MFDEEESTEGSRSRSEDSVISQAQRDNVAAAATAVVNPAAPDGADLTATIDSVRSWVLASGLTAIARFAYAIGATEQSDQELEDDEQDEDEREQQWLLPSTLSDLLTPSSEPPSPPPSPSSEPVPPSISAVTDIDDEAPAAASKSSNVEALTSVAARPTEPESPPKPDKGTLVDLLQDRVLPTVLEQLQQVHELGLRLLEVQIGKYAEVRIPTDAESRYYLIATTAHLQSVTGVLYARLEDGIATPEDFRSFFSLVQNMPDFRKTIGRDHRYDDSKESRFDDLECIITTAQAGKGFSQCLRIQWRGEGRIGYDLSKSSSSTTLAKSLSVISKPCDDDATTDAKVNIERVKKGVLAIKQDTLFMTTKILQNDDKCELCQRCLAGDKKHLLFGDLTQNQWTEKVYELCKSNLTPKELKGEWISARGVFEHERIGDLVKQLLLAPGAVFLTCKECVDASETLHNKRMAAETAARSPPPYVSPIISDEALAEMYAQLKARTGTTRSLDDDQGSMTAPDETPLPSRNPIVTCIPRGVEAALTGDDVRAKDPDENRICRSVTSTRILATKEGSLSSTSRDAPRAEKGRAEAAAARGVCPAAATTGAAAATTGKPAATATDTTAATAEPTATAAGTTAATATAAVTAAGTTGEAASAAATAAAVSDQ